MSAFKIQSPYQPKGDQPEAIKSIVDSINKGSEQQVLLGITGSGKTFTMANVIQEVNKPTLILSHNKTLAAQLYGEFKALFPKNAVEFFISYYDYYQPEAYMPITDTYIEKDASINEEIDRLRLKATTSLVARKDVIIISSVSCIYGLGSPTAYREMLVELSVSDTINFKNIFKKLIEIHYTRNDLSLEHGTFRMRGDIIEIFPIYDDNPIRIDLFGNEIQKISTFNIITGEIISTFPSFYIYPAKHFVTSRDSVNSAIKDITSELNERLQYLRSNDMLLEAQRLEQRTMYDMEMMMELGYCSGIENYSMHLDKRSFGQRPHTLLDFFPSDFLMFIDESHVTIPQIRAMYNGDKVRKTSLVEHGFRLPSAMNNRPMKFNEFVQAQSQTVYVSATPSEYEVDKSNGLIVEQIIRPTGLLDPIVEVRSSNGQIDDLISEIRKATENSGRVLITTLTKRMAEDLSDYLKSVNVKAEYLHSDITTIDRVNILRSLRMGEFNVLVGINLLREGLDLPEVSLVAVIDANKEGFLRSKTSLLQVAGRAARNVNGRVILYGDTITESMQYLIDETKRRRKIQSDYNKKHKITPKTVVKTKEEIKSSTAVADGHAISLSDNKIEINTSYLDGIETKDQIEIINRKMLKCARNLQFEEAAILRDQIDRLKGK